MDLDLAAYQGALNLIHVLAVMAFILCHGFSGLMALRIRGERDRERIQTMVQVADSFLNWGWLALAVVFFGGILAGIAGGWWTSGRLWIWVSLVLFIVVAALMTPVAGAYMVAVRRALGQPSRDDRRKGRPAPEPATDEELAVIVASDRPIWAAVIGLAGIVALTWLMVDKPF
jgi:uncharacterized membrane protein